MKKTAMIVAILSVMAMPAEAGYCAAWGYRTFCRGANEGDVFSVITGRSCIRRHVCRQWVHGEPYYERERRYGYRAVERDYDDGRRAYEPECKTPLSVVGDASLTQDGAKYEGEQSWVREVRWRFGAAYSDMNNARNIRWGCGRSSVRNIPGTTRPLQFTCELSAQPCRVKKEKEEMIVVQPPPSGRPAP